MKARILCSLHPAAVVVVCLGLLANSARADLEDRIAKSFPVQPGGKLVAELDRGAIEISSADAETVEIEITRKAGGTKAQAQRTLDSHQVTITQTGNTVEIRARYDAEKTTGWIRRSPELQVKCRVLVPRRFDVDLKTAGGNISVNDLTGKVEAHTSGGYVSLGKIEGELAAHTSGGNITVASAKGCVDVKTSGGGLNLSDIAGDLTAQTAGGPIRARKRLGKSILKTSGGGIEVADSQGTIEARTSGGSITASLSGQPAGDCVFKTSGGSVTIALGKEVAVDVDARTSAGHVSTDFPVVSVIQGEQKKSELRGKINGGGPLITAHTSGGSVRLQEN
jgi:DUF4097 and DUF4098 domain-containing protein YvlB